MPVTYPCNADDPPSPGLYTFYAVASLLVVVLAVTLIWIPFVKLIAEINTIITKVLIYFNTQLLGYKNTNLFNALEALFLSEESLILISVCCITYGFYLASRDFLMFAGCYICNLPNIKPFKKLKEMARQVIEYLLNLTEKKTEFMVPENVMGHHRM